MTLRLAAAGAGRLAPTSNMRMAAPEISAFCRSFASAKEAPSDQDAGEALPFFTPKPALPSLPNVWGVSSKQLEMRGDRRAKTVHRDLMRSIDLENRLRHDMDGRTQLISRSSPNAIKVGSILLVEYVTSRSKAHSQYFAGVLIQIRRNGMMSSFLLRTKVLKTGVEMLFPLYSPMVTKIRVLQPPSAELGKDANSDDITWVREKGCPGVDYSTIDEMVARYKSAQERLEQRMRMQQEQLQGQQ